jgi:hypothetical protein
LPNVVEKLGKLVCPREFSFFGTSAIFQSPIFLVNLIFITTTIHLPVRDYFDEDLKGYILGPLFDFKGLLETSTPHIPDIFQINF